MSSDNGVYILRSPVHQDLSECEYRVAHTMAIDNISYEPNMEGFNTEELKRYFGKCSVLNNRTKALLLADTIAQTHEILEYGIQFINLPFVFPR